MPGDSHQTGPRLWYRVGADPGGFCDVDWVLVGEIGASSGPSQSLVSRPSVSRDILSVHSHLEHPNMHTITFDSHVPPDSIHGHEQWFLVLDGEPLTDTFVAHYTFQKKERLPDLIAGSSYSSSLISKLPVGELLARFQKVMVWFTPIIEDHIHHVSLHRSLSEDDNVVDPKLIFDASVDLQHWAKPFSIVQFFDAIEQVVSKNPMYRLKVNQYHYQSNDVGIYIDIKELQASIDDLVEAHRLSLRDIIHETYAILAATVRRDSLVSFSNSHQPLRQLASSTLSTSLSS